MRCNEQTLVNRSSKKPNELYDFAPFLLIPSILEQLSWGVYYTGGVYIIRGAWLFEGRS